MTQDRGFRLGSMAEFGWKASCIVLIIGVLPGRAHTMVDHHVVGVMTFGS